MKKLFFFFLGACLLTLASSPAMAQTGSPEVVVLQLYFTGGNGGFSNGHRSLTRPTGTSETAFKNMPSRQ